MKKLSAFVLAANLFLCAAAYADVYMHNPRGSNNRVSDAGGSGDALQDFVDWVVSLF